MKRRPPPAPPPVPRMSIEPGVAHERPPEPPAPIEISVGDVIIFRSADPKVFYRYVAYPSGAPKTWQTVLWGRAEWPEVCHLLGIYPCRIECLRCPANWTGPLPAGFDELSSEEIERFTAAQRDGGSLLPRRNGPVPPSKPPADPLAPQPVISMEVAERRVPDPPQRGSAVALQMAAIAAANEASEAVRAAGGSDKQAREAYDAVIASSTAWDTTGRVPVRGLQATSERDEPDMTDAQFKSMDAHVRALGEAGIDVGGGEFVLGGKHEPRGTPEDRSMAVPAASEPEPDHDFGLPPFEWPSSGQGSLF